MSHSNSLMLATKGHQLDGKPTNAASVVLGNLLHIVVDRRFAVGPSFLVDAGHPIRKHHFKLAVLACGACAGFALIALRELCIRLLAHPSPHLLARWLGALLLVEGLQLEVRGQPRQRLVRVAAKHLAYSRLRYAGFLGDLQLGQAQPGDCGVKFFPVHAHILPCQYT